MALLESSLVSMSLAEQAIGAATATGRWMCRSEIGIELQQKEREAAV